MSRALGPFLPRGDGCRTLLLGVGMLSLGCTEAQEPEREYFRLDFAEPGRAGCTITGSEDRDSNGHADFERRITYSAEGLPGLLRETESDNGGLPPKDPVTFRIETWFDERGNPTLQEEGPDDDSPRTQTAWRWDYSRSVVWQYAEVDRRNNGEDLTFWSMEYERGGRLLSWQLDATETTGLVTQMTYTWDDVAVVEVERLDSPDGDELEQTALWRLENDDAGRLLRRVEIEDGQEGRQAALSRDEDGRLRRRVGGWGPLGEWSPAEVTYSSPCFGD